MFARTLGETSDVVTKEMYTFEDRGGDSITLRPENTAGVCRALVSNGLTQSLPQKVFYAGPMFRYERPQKGRYRQFHQIGDRADRRRRAAGRRRGDRLRLGHPAGARRRRRNGARDQHARATAESRDAYRDALVDYFAAHRDGAFRGQPRAARAQSAAHPRQQGRGRPRASSPTRRPSHGAPDRRGRAFYARLQAAPRRASACRSSRIPRIVRGLDYYSHTAFEFVTDAARRAGHGDGRRPLRRAGGGDGRPADAGGRLGGGHRAPGDAAAPNRPRARVGRGDPGGRRGRGCGARRAAGAAARRASAPRWPIAATSSAAWSAPTGSARGPR